MKFLIGIGGVDALKETNGIKYWMNTRENGKHNLPHVHVKYNEEEVIIGILEQTNRNLLNTPTTFLFELFRAEI